MCQAFQGVKPGSSPHTRGLPLSTSNVRATGRIIPAHAGFTPVGEGGRVMGRDHPRTRGVYPPPGAGASSVGGSSPHTRGLRHRPWPSAPHLRIIPAHAGFTCPGRGAPTAPPDHPRTRGVYDVLAEVLVPSGGSSPHTRGLHHRPRPRRHLPGIIPAHAGFTPRAHSVSSVNRDHPRTRGVYDTAGELNDDGTGSSPHTRGLRRW